jgi:hypothetical protein
MGKQFAVALLAVSTMTGCGTIGVAEVSGPTYRVIPLAGVGEYDEPGGFGSILFERTGGNEKTICRVAWADRGADVISPSKNTLLMFGVYRLLPDGRLLHIYAGSVPWLKEFRAGIWKVARADKRYGSSIFLEQCAGIAPLIQDPQLAKDFARVIEQMSRTGPVFGPWGKLNGSAI